MAHMLMSLRAVNHRLINLPVQKLPSIAASLGASITECGALLSTPQSQKAGKADSDHAVQVHKLVTRLSSLLQDRTCEGRWAAVVLVKALVEAGQWEILRGSEPFVRGLLSILNRSDPASTKIMAVITLTRIFHLIYQYPTLVREIATPSLPGFISSTLNLISVKPSSEPTRKLKPNSPFLEVVLRAYAELIARHPTIFRPFTSQIHNILQAIVGSTSVSFPQSVLDIAQQLFVALHHCAPKNTGGEEWKNACRMTITSIHAASNHVLRAIVEQWESVDPSLRQQLQHSIDYAREAGNDGPDALGLSGWQGLDEGVDRLLVLLRMLATFLKTATASTVSIPLGPILDLTARLMVVTVPSDLSDVQANPEVGRTEREHLLAELPRIHAGCIDLFRTLVNTLETAVVPVAQTILEQTLWVFRAEKFSKKIRTSVYDLVHALLKHIGPSMNKKNVSSLSDIIRTSCSDLLPPASENGTKAPSSDSKGKSKMNPGAVNADFFLNPNLKQGRQTRASTTRFPKLTQAASNLLTTVLTQIPTEFLSPPIRAEIDRTIILTFDKNAMYASVLNPFPAARGRGANFSIMPFLARSFAAEMDVEALIRPRMPVLTNSNAIGKYVDMEEDEEEEEVEPISSSSAPVHLETTTKVTGFLKQSPTPNLQDLVDSNAPQKFTLLNKRTYIEESDIPISSKTPESAAGVTGAQIKKARFEDISVLSDQPLPNSASSTPLSSMIQTSSTKQASPSSVLGTNTSVSGPGPVAAISEHMPSSSSSSLPHVGETTTLPAADDSDEEMPTLNIEPDTDEDEEQDEE